MRLQLPSIISTKKGTYTMKNKICLLAGLILLGFGIYLTITFLGEEKKAESSQTIVAFGDSLTYGYGDETEEGYIGRLQSKLDRTFPDKNYKITNHGVYGYKSSDVLQQMLKPKVAQDIKNADMFIVYIGTNDLLKSNGGDLYPLHHEKLVEAKDIYEDKLNGILETLETANRDAPVILLGLYNPYPDGDQIEKYIDHWNKSIRKKAAEDKKITYVSTNELFKGKNKKQYFADSLHPNGKGYELIADKIIDNYSF
ncbi:lysophospholipase L1-like esterase [Cytobacillus firmus]|uniref:Lysophospholipase L1-like esterase n=2 Tax=Cytobacillus TaxID=2675230 RepID=A0A366JTL0_CYTFI|nr:MULTISPECIES: GDSL-type esterase/lipase family protein [Cytobacillus]RBP91428.1 lysophospholipase L1-like esterase [Cytobacillus firmus]TDX41628.1 lysophospholipase L1-like esterase [Cytobacillus oceanisediminis]